jgi:hypothetical protein
MESIWSDAQIIIGIRSQIQQNKIKFCTIFEKSKYILLGIKRKCVLKRKHKILGHDMYVINILVCGSYGNFQENIHLDMGVCFFCEGVRVSVYFSSCESEFVCFLLFMFMWICLCVSI